MGIDALHIGDHALCMDVGRVEVGVLDAQRTLLHIELVHMNQRLGRLTELGADDQEDRMRAHPRSPALRRMTSRLAGASRSAKTRSNAAVFR